MSANSSGGGSRPQRPRPLRMHFLRAPLGKTHIRFFSSGRATERVGGLTPSPPKISINGENSSKCQNPFHAFIRLKKERKKMAWNTKAIRVGRVKPQWSNHLKKHFFMCVFPQSENQICPSRILNYIFMLFLL